MLKFGTSHAENRPETRAFCSLYRVHLFYRQPGIEQEGKRTVSLASLPDLPRLGRECRTHLALRQGKWSTPRTESDAKPEQHTIKASGGSSTAGRRPTHPGAYRAA